MAFLMERVPERIVVDPGEQEGVEDTIDGFFEGVIRETGLTRRCYDRMSEEGRGDNRITYLLCQDRVVAGVFERRTEFNRVEYVFFRDLNGLSED